MKDKLRVGRIHFTTAAEEAVKFGEVQFIAVGTPPDKPDIVDGRNLYEPAQVRKAGLIYYSVGRADPVLSRV